MAGKFNIIAALQRAGAFSITLLDSGRVTFDTFEPEKASAAIAAEGWLMEPYESSYVCWPSE